MDPVLPPLDISGVNVREILALLAPILDALVAVTPTPIDNIAWSIIKKLMLSDKAAAELHSALMVSGMAAPTGS